MTDLTALKSANARRWANARLTRNVTPAAKALVAAKPRYRAVEASTGVPWFVIAAIHERESSENWFASLAQGDPWNRVSVNVPAGAALQILGGGGDRRAGALRALCRAQQGLECRRYVDHARAV